MRPCATITLEDNGDAPYAGKGLKVAHGCLLKFIVPLGSVVCSLPFELYTNYPIHPTTFERTKFSCIKSESYVGHADWSAEITVTAQGCFSYYILAGGITQCKIGHFYVDPVISINSTPIVPEAITLQTVLPKCLGEFRDWEDKLAFSAHSGYNMLHFTPVQELGTSQSSYSIYDQLKLNSKLFTNAANEEEKWKQLAGLVKILETKYNMLSMTDLVWNHTADNSPWLVEHPEAGYNLDNSPHLKAAFEFDDHIMRFSEAMEGSLVKTETDLTPILM